MARERAAAQPGRIRVGIGGWIYAPWRGTFYPKGLKQADELAYAASHLTSIEINATHYRLQSPASFRKWGAAAPAGFKFSVKGPRLVTQQKALAETGNFIKRFFGSGLAELGEKLGPVLWQFAPFKRFDKDDLGKFLDHLPRELDGQTVDHVIEARHASFATTEFVALLRDSSVGVVFTEAEDFPSMADLTGNVVYARLQRGNDKLPAAYGPKAAHLATFPSSTRRTSPRRSRATSSSISSTRGSCEPPLPPWLSSSVSSRARLPHPAAI